jgi:hypothetical protein
MWTLAHTAIATLWGIVCFVLLFSLLAVLGVGVSVGWLWITSLAGGVFGGIIVTKAITKQA